MKRTPIKRRTPLRAKKKPRNYGGVRRVLESRLHADPKLAAIGARTYTNFPSEAEMILAAKRKHEKKTKHARRERAPESWWVFIKSLPCFVLVWVRDLEFGPDDPPLSDLTLCSGPIEADHMGDRFSQGDGTRARDWTCVPMCNGHHGERTNVRVARTFKGFTKEHMRAFRAAGIEWTLARARAGGVEIPDC